jgi:hypothetical protein
MRLCIVACSAAIAALPASAGESARMIDILPGHPVYHESEGEAGVVMAVSIAAARQDAADLTELCEELRVAAGLQRARGDELPLKVIFVVPYKGMAVEGYYLPAQGTSGREVLVRGNVVAPPTLGGILARAGIPPSILDETEVEHEISCEIDAPAWLIRWEDVRPIDDEALDVVIDRAHRRFMAIHKSVVEHDAGLRISAH